MRLPRGAAPLTIAFILVAVSVTLAGVLALMYTHAVNAAAERRLKYIALSGNYSRLVNEYNALKADYLNLNTS
ncbi:MAG: hypothetical protein ACP5NY_09360, partial [Thermocladium sp.]